MKRGTDTNMYSIDLKHYLDAKGAIGPQSGAARKFAEFVTAVVAHASDFDRSEDISGPLCIKCRKRDQLPVETGISDADEIVWRCVVCGTAGCISNWHGSFWDLGQDASSA